MNRVFYVFDLLGKFQKWYIQFIIGFNPNGKLGDEKIVFTWKDWRREVRIRHLLISIVILAIVLIVYLSLYEISVLRFSVISIIAESIGILIHPLFLNVTELSSRIEGVLILLLIVFSKRVVSFYGHFDSIALNLPQYAMDEELVFRSNSEKYGYRDRIISCLSFGFAHFGMLIVPVAALPALSLGGLVFMIVYLRTYKKTESKEKSLVQSATTHTTYNALLIVLLIGVIVVSMISLIATLF